MTGPRPFKGKVADMNSPDCSFCKKLVALDAVPADGSFDLVFLDPPWSLADEEVTREIRAAAALDPGELVVHRRRTSAVPPAPVGWQLRATYRYGDSLLLRYAQQYGDETERP